MINLTTGLPGNAKTLYMIRKIMNERDNQEKKTGKRPNVYYFNITFLEDHKYYDQVSDWVRLDRDQVLSIALTDQQVANGDNLLDHEIVEHGSIILLDECQDLYPKDGKDDRLKRAINFFTKHRHSGLNFYLVTQDPMFIHPDARRLVNYHYELDRHGKAEISNVRISPKGILEKCPPDLIKTDVFKFPKDYFGLYKSAVEHTQTDGLIQFIKGLPNKVKIIFIALFILVTISIYNLMNGGLSMFADSGQSPKPIEKQLSNNPNSQVTTANLNRSQDDDQAIFYISHYLKSNGFTLAVFDYVQVDGSYISLTEKDLAKININFKKIRDGVYLIDNQLITKRPFQKGAKDDEK